jgi:hypothetical protein
MTTKERLHQLIDQLDDARAEAMLVLLTPPNGATNGRSDDPEEDIDAITARDLARIASAPPLDENHPIWSMVGMFKGVPGGPTDVAENHDKYLAEAYADLHEDDGDR